MPGFSDAAHKKMIDLFNNHAHEVGSQIASAHPTKTPTNCITYIINVLKHAFEKTGDKITADKVAKMGDYGTKLAAYLVNDHKWKGVYYNPDVNHPRDGELEHPYSYYKQVSNRKKYYEVPISFLVINYRPTLKTNGNYKSFSGIGGDKKPTVKDTSKFDELKKIQFAVGVSRGGKHTWLYSFGKVYEVHWGEIGANLYEATNLEDYDWLSGVLAVPPDAMAAAKFSPADFWDEFFKVFKNWKTF